MNKNQSSIKSRIRLLFIFLITITISIVGFIVFYNWKSSVDNMIIQIQESTNATIANEIEAYINIPLSINNLHHTLIENQLIDIHDEASRDAYFTGVMQAADESVYSFSYGTAQGEYYGTRRNLQNQLEIMRSDTTTEGKSQYYSVKQNLTAGEIAVQLGSFDPRTRDWYRIAKETQRPVFSPVYKHFVMSDLALSASYPIYDRKGNLKGVLGTHITLSRINDFLKKIASENNATAYIVEKQSGELVANSAGMPNFTRRGEGDIDRININDITDPYIIAAYRDYKKADKTAMVIDTEKDHLFMKISEYKRNGLNWLIINIIPESPYIKEIGHSILLAVSLSLLAILMAIFIWSKKIDAYLAPIYELIGATEKFSCGDFTQRALITKNDEIGKLACAFNDMAAELHLLVNNLEQKVMERTKELARTNEELQLAKEKIELASQVDFLTSLYNRRFVLTKIEEETKRFTRSQKTFAIVMGDIDYFKKLNDTYGHDCGDLVLKETAGIMRQIARETDCVSRWGGEEFLLFLPETEAQGSLRFAERLRRTIEEKDFRYEDSTLKITMTLGIAVYQEGMTIDEVIKAADVAVYKGKQNGRNQVMS